MQEVDQEVIWLKKRAHRCTASETKKSFGKGAKKTCKKTGVDLTPQFGAGAITYINTKAVFIRHNDMPEQVSGVYSLEFGKYHEPEMIEWISENCGMDTVRSGIKDDGSVSFQEYAGEAGGDSTDYFVDDSNGVEYAVGEGKCPSCKEKALMLTDPKISTKESVRAEYEYQLATHLAAHPNCTEVHYTIYNAHINLFTGLPYNNGLTFKYKREEFQELIDQILYRIPRVHEFILLVANYEYEAKDINKWWEENNYDKI
jgi:hypothetical protein